MKPRGRRVEFLAKGSAVWSDYQHIRRAQIYMHEDIFARLTALAIADGVSMSAVARSLICDGLAARAKMDRAAPTLAGAVK